MAGSWLNLSFEEQAELYVEDVTENVPTLGVPALSTSEVRWLLQSRAYLERAGYLTTEIAEADALLLQAPLHEHYRHLAAEGPEWPLHIVEIQAGGYPLSSVPEHLRSIAREYAKTPA